MPPQRSLLNSSRRTMVMGASVGEKLVMVCGTPSSRMRKFSFFRLGMMSPCCVVATTSSVTMGTSTAMVTPAWGACCAGLAGLGESGFCCCCAGGGAPPCGPVGAWAKAGLSASGRTKAIARIASRTTERMAFIVRSPIPRKFKLAKSLHVRQCDAHAAAESTQPKSNVQLKRLHVHVSMKPNKGKTFTGAGDAASYFEEGWIRELETNVPGHGGSERIGDGHKLFGPGAGCARSRTGNPGEYFVRREYAGNREGSARLAG